MTHFNNTAQMDITTTIGCTVGCAYCPQKKTSLFYRNKGLPVKSNFMSFETFVACLSKIPKSVQINFAGYSEPFLNPLCTEMILYARAEGYAISLYTTLVGLSVEKIKQLSLIPFVSVDIHLPTTLGEERIPINDSYKEKLRIALDILLNSNCVKMDWEGNDILIDTLDNYDLKSRIYSVPINTRAANLSNDLIPHPPRRSGKLQCDRHLYSNVLLPNGDVTICCQDFGMNHIIGNLMNDTYENLFKSSEFDRVQRGLQNENADTLCRQCEYALNIT
ncbi:radical SAM/SPASM domain-containing protein [Limnothrix redekei]|uniref:SPASM domain-containing protein n=1 Tax=Limnothrix redekei LRLZ20PSL1 TaxID=3112953 RepID=A0ABW7C9X4_9CYAN